MLASSTSFLILNCSSELLLNTVSFLFSCVVKSCSSLFGITWGVSSKATMEFLVERKLNWDRGKMLMTVSSSPSFESWKARQFELISVFRLVSRSLKIFFVVPTMPPIPCMLTTFCANNNHLAYERCIVQFMLFICLEKANIQVLLKPSGHSPKFPGALVTPGRVCRGGAALADDLGSSRWTKCRSQLMNAGHIMCRASSDSFLLIKLLL